MDTPQRTDMVPDLPTPPANRRAMIVALIVAVLLAGGLWTFGASRGNSVHDQTCRTDAIALAQSTPGTPEFRDWAAKRVADGCT